MPTAKKVIEHMPEVFNAEDAGDMNANVVFDLSGEGGGKWTVSIANGECSVAEGATEDATSTIMMDAEDYVKMTSGELNAVTAFMMGQIKVEGDLNTVMKMQTLFDND
jgi:putative sterol carrier protein